MAFWSNFKHLTGSPKALSITSLRISSAIVSKRLGSSSRLPFHQSHEGRSLGINSLTILRLPFSSLIAPLKTTTSPQAAFPPSSGNGQYAATRASNDFSFSIVGASVISLLGCRSLIEVAIC